MKIDKTTLFGGLVLIAGLGLNILNGKNESLKQEKMKGEIIDEVVDEVLKKVKDK